MTVHGYHQNAQVLVDTYRCSGSACRVFSLLREYKRFSAQKAKKDASVVTHLHNMAASRYINLTRSQRVRFLGGVAVRKSATAEVRCNAKCLVSEGGRPIHSVAAAAAQEYLCADGDFPSIFKKQPLYVSHICCGRQTRAWSS